MSTDTAKESATEKKEEISLRPKFGGGGISLRPQGGGLFGAKTANITAGGLSAAKSTPFKKKDEATESKSKYDRGFMIKYQEYSDVPSVLQKTLDALPQLSNAMPAELRQALLRKGDLKLPENTSTHTPTASSRRGGRGGSRTSPTPGREKYDEDVAFGRKSANPYQARPNFMTNEKDQALRTLKGILNKLTPETFSRLTVQVCDIMKQIDDEGVYTQAVGILYAKAVIEPNFSTLYTELCVQVNDLPISWSEQPGQFRRKLIDQCQEEFEDQGKSQELPKDPEEQQMAKDKIKRRTLGNVNFIGELYKVSLISSRVVRGCIDVLFNFIEKAREIHDRESMEFQGELSCKLIKTVGKSLDSDAKTKVTLDAYFSTIKRFSTDEDCSARLKFLFRDLLELRENLWVPRRNEEGPKKISEIHQEAKDLELKLENEYKAAGGRAPSDTTRRNSKTKITDEQRVLNAAKDLLVSAEVKNTVLELQDVSKSFPPQKIVELLVLEVLDKKEKDITITAQLLTTLFSSQKDTFNQDAFTKGFKSVSEAMPDIVLDAPFAVKNMQMLISSTGLPEDLKKKF